jgi:nitrous oxidase accessory protein
MAKEWRVEPGNGSLQSAIDSAQSGDHLQLVAGTYTGSVNIHRSLTLSGNGVNGNAGDSIIDGEGSSHVILVAAPDVVIRGLNIQRSGNVAEDEDSGIFITDKGDRTRIENNHLENNLIGVYLKGPESVVVSNNVIIGSQFHRMNDRGNGVYLWNTPGSVIKDNVIRFGRDGIFVNGSRNNIFSGNHLSDLRFAIYITCTRMTVKSATTFQSITTSVLRSCFQIALLPATIFLREMPSVACFSMPRIIRI